MRVLLTGAAGFLGQHVARELASRGHEVVGLDSLRSDVHREPHPQRGMIVAEVRDPNALGAALPGVQVVCHPPCPHCGQPLIPALVAEDAPPDPRNAYAASKLAQEHLSACWARATGGSVAALRYHNVYGPGMPRDTPYAGVAAIFLSALRRGDPPAVFEDGGQRRDFVHVHDIATATAAAAERHTGGVRAFNVGSGTPRTVGDLARALAHALPGPAPVINGHYRLGDVRHITADSSRIRHELGWRPRVEFDDAVADLARTL